MASFSNTQASHLNAISSFDSMMGAYSYMRKVGGQVSRPMSQPDASTRTAEAAQKPQVQDAKVVKKTDPGSKKADRRGRPRKISDDLLQKMIQLIESSNGDVSWEELGQAVGVEGVHMQTIRNHMVKEGYCKRISCQQKWLTRKARETRMQYALAHQHWQNEWRSVLFSDVVNFGLGASRKARVFSRRDERLCEDCLQAREDADKSIYHCWGMVGYDYKSPLIFYSVEGSNNGVMSQQDFITRIVRPHVQPVATSKRMIYLEETNSAYDHSGNGPSMVQAFMESVNLPCLRNPESSSDLNVFKDVLLILKKRLQKRYIANEIELKRAVLEEWDKLTTREINKLVDSMKARMEKVLARKGKPI